MNIWAHRGCSYQWPENTLPAFKAACNYNIQGIELDIQLSKDEEIVVIHDESTKRTTDGTENVNTYTLQELKRLKILTRSGFLSKKYTRIPTMREVLDLLAPYCRKQKMLINIELKNSRIRYEGMEEKILELVEQYALEDYIIYSTFSPKSLQYLRKLNSKIKIATLCGKLSEGIEISKEITLDALHPSVNQLDMNYAGEGIRLPIRAWNGSEPLFPERREIELFDLAGLEERGVTDIFTNIPERYVGK